MMVRTQVQLDEQQFNALKVKAAAEGVSMAELIRRGIDLVLSWENTREERVRRALSAAGRFHSGTHDLSANHDRYLEEALRE